MFKGAWKATKYLGSMPLKILGITYIRRNNQIMRDQLHKLKSPICPHCYESVLFLDESRNGVRRTYEDGQRIVDLYHWLCQNPDCQADELLPMDLDDAREWAKQIHNDVAAKQIETMQADDMEPYLKTHRVFSRIMYLGAFICLLFLFYGLAFSNTSVLKLLIIYITIGAAFFVNGMKRSYRCWQIQNKRLFDQAAFKDWLRNGRWFV